jgi:preprotein translocase subunit SecG
MEQIVLLIHVLAAFGVIGLVLVQQGKGAEVGASFGAGASQTLFGSQGSGNFLTRATAILVAIFFASCLALGYLTTARMKPKSLDTLIDKAQQTEIQEKTPVKGSDIPKVSE